MYKNTMFLTILLTLSTLFLTSSSSEKTPSAALSSIDNDKPLSSPESPTAYPSGSSDSEKSSSSHRKVIPKVPCAGVTLAPANVVLQRIASRRLSLSQRSLDEKDISKSTDQIKKPDQGNTSHDASKKS